MLVKVSPLRAVIRILYKKEGAARLIKATDIKSIQKSGHHRRLTRFNKKAPYRSGTPSSYLACKDRASKKPDRARKISTPIKLPGRY